MWKKDVGEGERVVVRGEVGDTEISLIREKQQFLLHFDSPAPAYKTPPLPIYLPPLSLLPPGQ